MSTLKTEPLHIGIIGCSAEGAALCYKTICTEAASELGPYGHPQVSMHTHSFADYVARMDQDDWQGVGALMLSSANKLAQSGADFLICPDNTTHKSLSYVEDSMPLPFLHIAEVVAAKAKELGFQRLGLTGTRWLVESEVYPRILSRNGLSYVRPDEQERHEINRIIMEELVLGKFKSEAVEFLQQVIARMKEQGCDAVVLGCTEIPLIINEANSPLPPLDSTRLLARAAIRRAIAGVSSVRAT